MSEQLDLDVIQRIVNHQAISKGWKTEGDYCLKRAYQELDELKEAVEQEKTKEEITSEIIDIIYFLVQVGLDKAEGISLTKAFLKKLEHNWTHKKKTEDAKGNEVRK